LVRHPELRASIIEPIKDGWSPEQIAGRLAYERSSVRVCHETIYRFAYSSDGQGAYWNAPDRALASVLGSMSLSHF
jgi:IS30 family transposase